MHIGDRFQNNRSIGWQDLQSIPWYNTFEVL